MVHTGVAMFITRGHASVDHGTHFVAYGSSRYPPFFAGGVVVGIGSPADFDTGGVALAGDVTLAGGNAGDCDVAVDDAFSPGLASAGI